jgi:hypothetical protein
MSDWQSREQYVYEPPWFCKQYSQLEDVQLWPTGTRQTRSMASQLFELQSLSAAQLSPTPTRGAHPVPTLQRMLLGQSPGQASHRDAGAYPHAIEAPFSHA